MMEKFITILLLFGFLAFGIFLVFGAYKKITWLVDPSESYSPWYSQAFLKKYFGRKFVRYYTYILGILLIVISIWYLWKFL